MDTLSYKTISANKETVTKNWVIVDAENQVLGRFASEVAKMVRGKNKTNFTPHVDCGDNVIVINAEKIQLTGTKWDNKTYIHYTGYPGGQRELSAKSVMSRKPGAMIEKAVKGMLPKTRLGSAMFGNLYVYAGSEHPHAAQKPKQVKINTKP